ncbi:MAG: hypothetical protein IPK03_01965 [Bacteroidetes bacterium]|nr:hypothetical protein [Bacteroidota bacterium]
MTGLNFGSNISNVIVDNTVYSDIQKSTITSDTSYSFIAPHSKFTHQIYLGLKQRVYKNVFLQLNIDYTNLFKSDIITKPLVPQKSINFSVGINYEIPFRKKAKQ